MKTTLLCFTAIISLAGCSTFSSTNLGKPVNSSQIKYQISQKTPGAGQQIVSKGTTTIHSPIVISESYSYPLAFKDMGVAERHEGYTALAIEPIQLLPSGQARIDAQLIEKAPGQVETSSVFASEIKDGEEAVIATAADGRQYIFSFEWMKP